MKNKFVIFALATPFIILCLLIVRAEYHIQNSEQWQFEITGYDPRDLLRGHYLQFQIRYDLANNDKACVDASNCCLCLTKQDSKVPLVDLKNCERAKNQCDGHMLRASADALNRFYIPEEKATMAEKILQQARNKNNAYLKVAINPIGEAEIVNLLIGDRPIIDLLSDK